MDEDEDRSLPWLGKRWPWYLRGKPLGQVVSMLPLAIPILRAPGTLVLALLVVGFVNALYATIALALPLDEHLVRPPPAAHDLSALLHNLFGSPP